MKCDVLAFGLWDLLCEQVKTHLGLAQGQVKLYKGLSQALFEVGQGLASMVPHKQGVAYVDDVSPYFEPLLLHFSRSSYQLHKASSSSLQEPSSWAQAFLKDSALVLFNVDDPVTGKLYQLEPLLQELKDKRIYKLSVSHSSFGRGISEPGLYDVQFLSVTPDLCVVLLGERARFVDTVAPFMAWQENDLKPFVERSFSEDQNKVQAFEQNTRTELQPFFKGEARLYDRAVMAWPDVDGSAALTLLSEKLKIDSETTSLCRWPTVSQWKWLTQQGVSDETLRGLLIFDQRDLNESLVEALIDVRRELLKAQNGF